MKRYTLAPVCMLFCSGKMVVKSASKMCSSYMYWYYNAIAFMAEYLRCWINYLSIIPSQNFSTKPLTLPSRIRNSTETINSNNYLHHTYYFKIQIISHWLLTRKDKNLQIFYKNRSRKKGVLGPKQKIFLHPLTRVEGEFSYI